MTLPLQDHLNRCRARQRPVLSLYLTAGYPTAAATGPLLDLLDRNGADFIELGIPFSDPIADGPTIQHCSHVALQQGMSVRKTLELAAKASSEIAASIILMGYYNPIHHFGVPAFLQQAAQARVRGLIIPDLLPEESLELKNMAAESGISLIYLVTPNTSAARLEMIDELTTSFIYAVSITGVTGARANIVTQAQTFLQRLERSVRHPRLVGFGVADGDDARALAQHTDGVIVGSALLNHIRDHWGKGDGEKQIAKFVQQLRTGLGEGNHDA